MSKDEQSNTDLAQRDPGDPARQMETATESEGDTLPEVFADVFPVELDQITKRRRIIALNERGADPSSNLVGLALSGGGIRSATFCLGLLQGLREQRLLRIFDYLSTVSGGGYVGGWWSAWLARPSLGVQDLKSPRSFVAILKNDSAPSSALRERLSPKVRVLLSNYNEKEDPSDLLLTELLAELSELLAQHNFYDDRWQEFVSKETEEEFLEATRTEQFFWANRSLLRNAYPSEITSGIFPPHEGIEPRCARYQQVTDVEGTDERNGAPKATRETSSAWADPIHHLRLYANYLTPRRGLFSSDTWREITRNRSDPACLSWSAR